MLRKFLQYDITRIAPLMHRAANLSTLPLMQEVKFLLPKPALGVKDMKPAQWVNLVQKTWPDIAGLSPIEAKAQVLGMLLFSGYCFKVVINSYFSLKIINN